MPVFSPVLSPLRLIGRRTIAFLEFVGALGYLILDTMGAIRPGLLTGRGKRAGWQNLWAQMVRVGVHAIPIVCLVVFCIGAILALQMAPILRDYGALPRVADIIAVVMFRELGPLTSAIVLTGFAGASIAAELGSMVIGEEIEALEAHAINPIRFLVVPRVVATTVMMVCLAVVANLIGCVGGGLVGWGILDINPSFYIDATFAAVTQQDFVTGLVKSAVFGTIISGMACYLGLNVQGGAVGVGTATTRTVVLTIVALISVDLLFTAVFYVLGI